MAFEEVQDRYPPRDHQFFVPMSGRSMNRLRERFYLEAKKKGYQLISYISSRATTCHNEIGENCFILEGSGIQPFVRIGHNAIIWCQSHIGHHSVIEDHVYMGSGVIISGHCRIRRYSYLASNVVIDANVELAEGTLAGISAVIKRRTEPWGIYTGDPARRAAKFPAGTLSFCRSQGDVSFSSFNSRHMTSAVRSRSSSP